VSDDHDTVGALILFWLSLVVCLLSITGSVWVFLKSPPAWWLIPGVGLFFLACVSSLLVMGAMVERWPWWRTGKRARDDPE
jgi:membrane protein YdbS with pleckstrin-like domain